ncbi:hypothetical protein LA5095_00609 [Roseibium album]|uniref:Lipase (Class 3) n=2 Tax=Roseibium album TaxID=311410 RepID=A0A0M6ZEQ4_9HYPH|nr:hypothetical protein LA5094_03361 [Roseibium album]CTQ65624.1 hypothetical protein LA5095_00609 [Roseibium album]CTQ73674.1 hypothetical protein LA5096_03749 [Roseibium album]
MSVLDFFGRHPVGTAICVIVVLWLAGVQAYNAINLEPGEARISKTLESIEDIAAGKTASDLNEARHFAALSALVYGEPDERGVFQLKHEPGNCRLKPLLGEWIQFPVPDGILEAAMKRLGKKAKWDSDLVLGLWYREKSQTDIDVALVFRGTDGNGDFYSNFRWVTRLLPFGWDQYDLTRAISQDIVDKIKEDKHFAGKSIEVIAAGHSLGGGLAHQAGYAAFDIKRVYAFHSSSVTGYYDLDRDVRDKNRMGMRIYRIHERGEVLAYLRTLMGLIYPVVEKDPQIIEITYNFSNGNAVTQHSIASMACALIETHPT